MRKSTENEEMEREALLMKNNKETSKEEEQTWLC